MHFFSCQSSKRIIKDWGIYKEKTNDEHWENKQGIRPEPWSEKCMYLKTNKLQNVLICISPKGKV